MEESPRSRGTPFVPTSRISGRESTACSRRSTRPSNGSRADRSAVRLSELISLAIVFVASPPAPRPTKSPAASTSASTLADC
jgi:hypothetical protein